MRPRNSRLLPQGLLLMLAVSVLAELFLLRTATRTLIHIPGVGDLEAPIRVVAEVGRFAYYLAVVSVTVTLAILGLRHVRSASPWRVIAGVMTLALLLIAAAVRLEGVRPETAGWLTLVVLVVVTSTTWRGVESIPVGLFVLGSVAAGWSSLGQVAGSGLTGTQVDMLVLAAESLLVLAGATSPLLLGRPPTRSALVAGAGATVLIAAASAGGASTFSIMVLWNLGVPGWLPGIAFALAFGGVVTAIWSAMASGDRVTATGIVLLLGGGVGLISTYQTGLALAAILLLAEPGTTHREQTAEVGSTADYALAGSPLT
ncbi:MAG TPA: hypothetical protein VF083_07205 [Acidimicrobiia bacterium]